MPTPQEMVTAINARSKPESPEVLADIAAAAKTAKQKPGKQYAGTREPADVDSIPAPDYPKFLSTTGQPVVAALLSGHITCVSHDSPTGLHPRFHREAVARGAMPEAVAKAMQIEIDGHIDEEAEGNREENILRNIGQMVTQADVNPALQGTLFTKDGRPDCEALTQRCGFPVRAPERDRLWESYQGEIA